MYWWNITIWAVKCMCRSNKLLHALTRTTSSGCLVLHRTVHALWNLYGNPYEVRDLFLWEMLTETAISYFLNVEKIWNSAQRNLSSILQFYRGYFFSTQQYPPREIDQWNRCRFSTKWHVTVPNSVTPLKPIVCKWIYMSPGRYCQMTHKYTYIKISFASSWNCDFEKFLSHFVKKIEKCSFFVVKNNKS